MIYQDRWYQSQAVDSIFNYFENKNGNPLLAMPTGTGKSLVIAKFIKRVLEMYPSQRFMMLTHVKELIEQNANKVFDIWDTAPLGIYSAGLKSRDIALPIIFGGVQSVDNLLKKDGSSFGHRDLVIIDEAHLVSPNDSARYTNTLNALKETNPFLKVVGLTATPYRLKDGCLTNGDIFTDLCYDISDFKSFNRLVDDGYLSPLVTKQTSIEIDTSKIKITGGDYNKKQLETEADKITYAACREIVEYGLGQNRKSWLIFASGIEQAEHIAEILQSFGIIAVASHSKLDPDTNKKIIEDFKNGEIQALVNMNKYTTGFDHPGIDLIGMLRATISPGLWVQMLGRGTRPCDGKENCLVLDFAGNTRRLGPINDVVKPLKKGGKGNGTAPIRICAECGTYNHASARVCDGCGMEFTFESKLKCVADTAEVMKSDKPVIEWLDVKKVVYNEHTKKGSPPILKVAYFCGLKVFRQYVCFEHSGYPSKLARDWWRQRHLSEPPSQTWKALELTNELRQPKQIRVHTNKKYPEIIGVKF